LATALQKPLVLARKSVAPGSFVDTVSFGGSNASKLGQDEEAARDEDQQEEERHIILSSQDEEEEEMHLIA
jgi:hypothetical protein